MSIAIKLVLLFFLALKINSISQYEDDTYSYFDEFVEPSYLADLG